MVEWLCCLEVTIILLLLHIYNALSLGGKQEWTDITSECKWRHESNIKKDLKEIKI